jgi:hypothetical protein
MILKTGIYRQADLSRPARWKTFLGRAKRISITLYPDTLEDPLLEAASERILDTFTDADGAYKRTYAHRVEALNELLLELLADRPPEEQLLVHDVGVSDARSSVELFQRLVARWPTLRFYASDRSFEFRVLRSRYAILTIDARGRPVECIVPPLVMSAGQRETPWLYPVNAVMRRYAFGRLARRMLEAYAAGDLPAAATIRTVCRAADRLAASEPRFRLLTLDLDDDAPLPEPVDLIRAINVLNESYFGLPRLRRAVTRLLAGLRPGGLLAIGSNEGPGTPLHGTVLQRDASGQARERARLGDGWEPWQRLGGSARELERRPVASSGGESRNA